MYLFSICKCILNDFGLFVCLYLTCKFIVVSIVKSMEVYRKKMLNLMLVEILLESI